MSLKRLHSDRNIWRVYVSSYPEDNSGEYVGLLHDLGRMSYEEIREELERLGWFRDWFW